MSNSFDTFVSKLEAFFKSAEARVEEFAHAFLPKAEALLETALEDLAEIAGEAVLTQASSVLSGKEKFGNAVASVIQQVEASGKTVALQTAQTAVQTAYLTVQSLVNKAPQ